MLAGKWGNGDNRKKKLEAAGYNYSQVQAKVNELAKGSTSRDVYKRQAVEYSSCTGLNSITITAEYKKTDTSEWLNKKTIKPGSNVLGGELDLSLIHISKVKVS